MAENIGRQYELTLLQERSAGTFARVYLAEATGSDGLARIVAVKILKEEWSGSQELLARTRDEALLLARLHHRNILRVEALIEFEGRPTIVMEFVDGVDLKQLLIARFGIVLWCLFSLSFASQSGLAAVSVISHPTDTLWDCLYDTDDK